MGAVRGLPFEPLRSILPNGHVRRGSDLFPKPLPGPQRRHVAIGNVRVGWKAMIPFAPLFSNLSGQRGSMLARCDDRVIGRSRRPVEMRLTVQIVEVRQILRTDR